MARAPALSQETLIALGVEPLARLVLDNAGRDPAFKRLVMAALAGAKGPAAVAALVEKRLAGLERARGFVDWNKAKTFAADLEATVTSVVDGIAPGDPALAVATLLRFLKTAEAVSNRVDDSQGRVQGIYESAVEAMGPLAARLPAADKAALPQRITAALGDDPEAYLPRLIQAVGPHLDDATLLAWDRQFAAPPGRIGRGPHAALEAQTRAYQALTARQMLAIVRKDLDGFAALEETKPAQMQNGFALAQLFLKAGRPQEALAWVRREKGSTLRYMRATDLSDHVAPLDYGRLQRTRLEAEILDALGDRPAAQALRWSAFAETLDPETLRAYMAALGEFEEFDALDRAFAEVDGASRIHGALAFWLEWPRLDKAAALVVRHHGRWDGRSYELLAEAADTLEPEHPAAAALLYRCLLDAVLTLGRSNAYGYGARYLAKLDALAGDIDRAGLPGVALHVAYRAELAKTHGRKAAFWDRVKGGAARHADPGARSTTQVTPKRSVSMP